MAGTGKTTLAAVLANDPDIERAFPDGTLWASAERSRDFREILTRWIQVLSPSINVNELDGVDEWSLSTVFFHVIQRRRILIVLDGVDRNNVRYIQSFIKAIGPECRVLITSRIINLPGVETIVSLDLLPEHQAVLLIEKDIGRKLALEEKEVAREIAFLLGYLPLALKIAVSRARVTGVSLIELRDSLRSQISRIGTVGLDEIREKLASVETIFNLTYAHIAIGEQAKFRALSVFKEPFDTRAAATIWRVDVSEAEHILVRLVSLSFLNSNDGVYTMHPLTHAFSEKLLQTASQDEQVGVQEAYADYLRTSGVNKAPL